jgi:NAD(P)-dependent dehydrogenase (short-subunit alcohol dehydrogenase family)
MHFQRKRALITGAGGSIGRLTAIRLAQEGAHIVAADVDYDAAEETVSRIESKTGQTALPVQADVTSPDSVAQMVDTSVDRLGGVDILFNSAGVFELGSVTEVSEEDWDRQVDVNLKGTFLSTKYVIPHMIRNGGGAIINASSIAGVVSFPRNAAYSASKGGVVLLTKNLALDYIGDNIRVNCVCPYSIEGPMMDRYFDEQPDPAAARDAIESGTPIGRMATIHEVVEPVLFLASDAASYITGVALVIDGGYSAT